MPEPYPKHFLAEVPQELRLRVLDHCAHRRWDHAMDLLQKAGFTQYEWHELAWFYWHAPTELDPARTSVGVNVGTDCQAVRLPGRRASSRAESSETTPNSKPKRYGLAVPNSALRAPDLKPTVTVHYI